MPQIFITQKFVHFLNGRKESSFDSNPKFSYWNQAVRFRSSSFLFCFICWLPISSSLGLDQTPRVPIILISRISFSRTSSVLSKSKHRVPWGTYETKSILLNPMLLSVPYVEGSCISDPCWWVINCPFLFPLRLISCQVLCSRHHRERSRDIWPLSRYWYFIFSLQVPPPNRIWWFAPAVNVVAKGISVTTETHSPVAVMCNSTTVSSPSTCHICISFSF